MTDQRRADRERHFSGGIWEKAYGYSRAMRVDRFVLVSGCTSMVEGRVRFPADPGAQVRVAIKTALAALAELGAVADDVVHAELFGASPPVATMVIVAGLLHPDMRVEIEVEAVLPDVRAG
jgi:enamine deaminase RidA (YjgF/YER057c/UK114 family)